MLAAKQAGRLPVARPVLERLRDNGMYQADAVLQRALRFVGEQARSSNPAITGWICCSVGSL